jgi:hypothetical protein
MWTFNDFMCLLLGFWDTPVPSAGATPVRSSGPIPVEHPEGSRFNRTDGAGGAGRFPKMNADCGYPLGIFDT